MARNENVSEGGRKKRGMEPAKKQSLASLVWYESGSVVSRTIVDRKAGTITLFAFDDEEGLSEHTAAYDALLYIIEGGAVVTVSGVSSNMKEGEAIILPARMPHSVRATTRFKMLLTMIRG